MRKMPRFLSLLGYEFKRILRNRAVTVLLLSFAVVLIVVLFFLQSAKMVYPIAVYTEDGAEIKAATDEFLGGSNANGMKYKVYSVTSVEEGVDMIRRNKATFFVHIRPESETAPVTATFYYDEANRLSRGIAYDLLEAGANSAYRDIAKMLEEYGISPNEANFQPLKIQSVGYHLRYDELAFVMEIAVAVSLILMLGLAYSVSRDRETDVSKNLAYLPIGRHEYMLSKLIPYFCLGLLQMIIVFVIGSTMIHIQFRTSLVLVCVLSLFFVTATLSVGLLFSTMKSQISTVFCSVLAVMLPVFISLLIAIEASPILVQIFCYLFPIIPFMQLATGMLFNGVIIWWDIPIMAAQTVVYYLAASFLLKKQQN